jgi:hypothetical protein
MCSTVARMQLEPCPCRAFLGKTMEPWGVFFFFGLHEDCRMRRESLTVVRLGHFYFIFSFQAVGCTVHCTVLDLFWSSELNEASTKCFASAVDFRDHPLDDSRGIIIVFFYFLFFIFIFSPSSFPPSPFRTRGISFLGKPSSRCWIDYRWMRKKG